MKRVEQDLNFQPSRPRRQVTKTEAASHSG